MAAFDPTAFDYGAFDAGSQPLPSGVITAEAGAARRVAETGGLVVTMETPGLRVIDES